MAVKWREPVTHMRRMRAPVLWSLWRERCKDEIKEDRGGKVQQWAGQRRLDGWLVWRIICCRGRARDGISTQREWNRVGGRVMNDERCGWEDGKKRWMRERKNDGKNTDAETRLHLNCNIINVIISFFIWNAWRCKFTYGHNTVIP